MSKDEANKFDFIKKNSAWGKNTTDKVKKKKQKERKSGKNTDIITHTMVTMQTKDKEKGQGAPTVAQR